MASVKKKEPEHKKLKIEWDFSNPVIPKVNAFSIIYSKSSMVLMIGLIDPVILTESPEDLRNRQPVMIKTLGRFSFDFDDFKRLKEEVDTVYGKMEKGGEGA